MKLGLIGTNPSGKVMFKGAFCGSGDGLQESIDSEKATRNGWAWNQFDLENPAQLADFNAIAYEEGDSKRAWKNIRDNPASALRFLAQRMGLE